MENSPVIFDTFYAVISEIRIYVCVYEYIHTTLYIVTNPTLIHQN